MKAYLDILNNCLNNGTMSDNRTGIKTLRIPWGATFEHDMSNGFPLVTTKKIHMKSVIYELLWLLRGDTNIKYLNDHGVTIWDEWADENGDLGPVYGHQWRNFNS